MGSTQVLLVKDLSLLGCYAVLTVTFLPCFHESYSLYLEDHAVQETKRHQESLTERALYPRF